MYYSTDATTGHLRHGSTVQACSSRLGQRESDGGKEVRIQLPHQTKQHPPAQHGAMVKCGARACRAHAQCDACHCGTLLTLQWSHVHPILRRAAPCCALTLRTLRTLRTLLRCPGLQARAAVCCFDGAALVLRCGVACCLQRRAGRTGVVSSLGLCSSRLQGSSGSCAGFRFVREVSHF